MGARQLVRLSWRCLCLLLVASFLISGMLLLELADMDTQTDGYQLRRKLSLARNNHQEENVVQEKEEPAGIWKGADGNGAQHVVMSEVETKEGSEIKLESTQSVRSSIHDNTSQPANTNSYKMVVGIVTAKRDPPTIIKMAEELVRPIKLGNYKLLVWQSESATNDIETAERLRKLGCHVHTHSHPYQELDEKNVKITYKDPLERVIWRTSHVLDYANLLELTLEYQSDFVMILEDDLRPAKHALDKSYQFAKENFATRRDWGVLTMYSGVRRRTFVANTTGNCSCGACALVYRRSIIPEFIAFLRKDPYLAPVDMMLLFYLESLNLSSFERTPNLFQHISQASSYTGADQKKRKSERWRSVSFETDEDNLTLSSIPSSVDGYIGCYKDNVTERDLFGLFRYKYDGIKKSKPSPSLCAEYCQDYFYFGLQDGGDCHCGNEFGRYGEANEKECNKRCFRDPEKICGGALRNSVYRTKPFQSVFMGCHLEQETHRDFPLNDGSFELQGSGSPQKCEQFCHGSKYFALQNGGMCICGNSYGIHGKADVKLCSLRCSDDQSQMCGGTLLNSVYRLPGSSWALHLIKIL